MKVTRLIAVLGLAAICLSGCGSRRPVLRIYIWADYLAPEIVTDFERVSSCRVKIDTFDSNETMYAKLKEGGASYDLVVPSSYQVSIMIQNNMLQPLNKELLPNVIANFDSSYRNVVLNPKMTHSVPYAFSCTGIAYRKDKVGGVAIDSWDCLGNPAFAGRVSLLDDYREVIGAALKSLGYSVNTTNSEEIQKAKEVVLRWKKNAFKFDNEAYKTSLANGELDIVHGYNCDILQVMVHDEEKIVFAFPKEGFAVSCDEMVIPANAKAVDLAHAFINFLYVPDNAAQNIQHMCAPMPNIQGLAKLSEKYRAFPTLLPFPEIMAKSEVIKYLGEADVLYLKAWEEIMAAE